MHKGAQRTTHTAVRSTGYATVEHDTNKGNSMFTIYSTSATHSEDIVVDIALGT